MNNTPSVLTDDTKLETVSYDYNLQNRLAKVTKDYTESTDDIREITEYKYNPDGIKVKSVWKKYVNDFTPANYTDIETKDHLIDSANHTGYAQTIKETVTDTGTTETTYIIGSDVLAQAQTYDTLEYLLYDGHGSTRQVIDNTGAPVGIQDSYSYDAYGVAVGFDASSSAINLLYSGEQYDSHLSQYYLRARYYDPLNGRFNRVDPFSGNNSDPQSLNKYLYCHANPVNGIDPSGHRHFSLKSVGTYVIIALLIAAVILLAVNPIRTARRDHPSSAKHEEYNLKEACKKYDYVKCRRAGIPYYNQTECEDDAELLTQRYSDWLDQRWTSGPRYSHCHEYQHSLMVAQSALLEGTKWFVFQKGYYTLIGDPDSDSLTFRFDNNIIGIFHICNRRIDQDGFYHAGATEDEISDARLDPWSPGYWPWRYNRGYGNPNIRPGIKSQYGWQGPPGPRRWWPPESRRY